MYNLDLGKHSPISKSMSWIYEILHIETWTYSKKTKEYLKFTKTMKDIKRNSNILRKQKVLPALDVFLKRILSVISYRISWNVKSWGHLGSDSSSKLQFYRSAFFFFFLVLAYFSFLHIIFRLFENLIPVIDLKSHQRI